MILRIIIVNNNNDNRRNLFFMLLFVIFWVIVVLFLLLLIWIIIFLFGMSFVSLFKLVSELNVIGRISIFFFCKFFVLVDSICG